MDSGAEWAYSLGIPLGVVFVWKEFVNPYVFKFLYSNKETIGGVVTQGKEVYAVVKEYGPMVWRKVKRYFTEMKEG